MRWCCCCRQGEDKKKIPPKPGRSSTDSKRSSEFLKQGSLSESSVDTESEDIESGEEKAYEDVRKYDERQIESQKKKSLVDEASKTERLSERIYYPPYQRRNSRIPLEQQRAEASRLKSVGKESGQKRKQSLLEASQDAGKEIPLESAQKQLLYKELTRKPA